MGSIVMTPAGPDWRLITDPKDGRLCRQKGCQRAGVFELNRGGYTRDGKVDRWWAYCDLLDHCYHRVLLGGVIYFVFETNPEWVEALFA